MSKGRDDARAFLVFPIFAGIVIVALVAIYAMFFWSRSIGGPEEFGQFGDFLGGVANPILGFITIVLLLISIRVQLSELKASRQELSDTRREFRESNRLFKEQSDLLQRQHQRQMLERHFEASLTELERCFTRRISEISDADISNIDSYVTLEVLRVKSRRKGGVAQDRWEQADGEPLAKYLRGCCRQVVNAAIALILLTDNSLMTDIIVLKVRNILWKVRDIAVLSEAGFSEFDSLMESAIADRERNEFPEFVRHTRI